MRPAFLAWHEAHFFGPAKRRGGCYWTTGDEQHHRAGVGAVLPQRRGAERRRGARRGG